MASLHQSYEVTTAPTDEPIDVNDCKRAARVDTGEEDSLIASWIQEIREAVEIDASICLMPQTLRLNMDGFPDWEIPVRRWPLVAVSSITYVDTGGTTQTVSASDYIVDTTSFPPRIVPAFGLVWPPCREQPRSVKVTFTAGYTSSNAVPELAKQAIRLGVAKRIREREGLFEEEYQRAFDNTVNRLRRFNMV